MDQTWSRIDQAGSGGRQDKGSERERGIGPTYADKPTARDPRRIC